MAMSTNFKELQQELGISDLAATFADIVHMSALGSNTVDVFSMLTLRIVEILPVEACGILLADVNHTLQVVGSSHHSAHQLDLYQLQSNSGPCMQAYETGEVVADTQLSPTGQWAEFARLATELGFAAVYAIPLAGRSQILGALNLFCNTPLSERDLTLAQVLSDAATVALLQADPKNDEIVVVRNTASTISSRNALEQAKGVLSQRYDIDMNAAYRRIQAVATTHQLGIVELSTAIANRTISDSIADALNNA
jgi:hypothetical protein